MKKALLAVLLAAIACGEAAASETNWRFSIKADDPTGLNSQTVTLGVYNTSKDPLPSDVVPLSDSSDVRWTALSAALMAIGGVFPIDTAGTTLALWGRDIKSPLKPWDDNYYDSNYPPYYHRKVWNLRVAGVGSATNATIRLQFTTVGSTVLPPQTLTHPTYGALAARYYLKMVDNRGKAGAPANGTIWSVPIPTVHSYTPYFTLTLPAFNISVPQSEAKMIEEGYVMEFYQTAPVLDVYSITPSSGPDTGIVSITNLAGQGFQSGATVKLTKSGQEDIAATEVTVVSPTWITCVFNLAGKAPGQWNVVVTNPDGESVWLTNGFTVIEAIPHVSSITPNFGPNAGSVSITDLAGTDFQTGATVKLRKSGQADIAATEVTVVTPTMITCVFDLAGRPSGQWNVVVTNPDARSGTLIDGFAVIEPIPIGEVKSLPTGSWVYVADAVVTAPSLEAGSVFVESSDRSGGIKLVTNQALSPGDRVKFTGLTGRVDGEYRIDDVLLYEPASPGAVLDPVAMITRAIGNDRAETLDYVGINTTGLLVSIVGRVTGVITAQNVVYLDDGGNYEDGYGPVLGLRCHVSSGVSTSWNNKYYAVTGISRVQKVTLTVWGRVNGDWYPPGTIVYVPYVDALSLVLLYP